MNSFEIAELKGRGLFREFIEPRVKKIIFTTDLYDRIDGYFRLGGDIVSVEIKRRDKGAEGYSTHLMEIDKYDAMIADKKKRNIGGCIYACFFGDDTLYLYDVSKVVDNSIIQQKYCPRTTAAYSDYVWKDCYMIDKRIATVFKRVNGVWSRQEN